MKINGAVFFILLGVIMANDSCKSNKPKQTTGIAPIVYKYEQGVCFGKCPVYTLEIDENGFVYYDAKRFNKLNGKLERQLTKEEFDHVKKAMDKVDLFHLQVPKPEYEVADLPTQLLTHVKNGMTKTVKAEVNMPESYNAAIKVMQDIAGKDGWILIDKYEEELLDRSAEESTIYNEIIIVFHSGVNLPSWFKDQEKNTVRLVKALNGELNMWLITFDRTKVEPKTLLENLKKDKAVSSAEFNKKLQTRN